MTAIREIKEFDLEQLPVGASVLIIGKRYSGKSLLQSALIEAMARNFKIAFGLSPTAPARKRFRECMPAWCVFPLSIDILQNICDQMKRRYERQANFQKKRKPDQWLLVLDDTAYDEKFMKSTALKEVFANGRNFGCTVIVIVQYIKAAPPIMRTNSDIIFCFAERGEKERKLLHEQYFSEIPRKDFNTVFSACTENYSTLVADNRINTKQNWTEKFFWFRARTDLPDFFIGTRSMQIIDKKCFIPNPDLADGPGQNVLLVERDENSDEPKEKKKKSKKRSTRKSAHQPLAEPQGEEVDLENINLDDFDFDN